MGCSVLWGYHDKCGQIFRVPWGVQYCGDIMINVGRYLEYHGGCQYHGGISPYRAPPTVLNTHYTDCTHVPVSFVQQTYKNKVILEFKLLLTTKFPHPRTMIQGCH